MSHDQYDFLKELKMCLHKLARRHVGTPMKYQRLHNRIVRIVIGL